MSQDIVYDFEWDPAKAFLNQRDHRITFDQAATVFLDPLALTVYDPTSSQDEERWFTPWLRFRWQALGCSAHIPADGPWPGAGAPHISARKATKRERRSYEEEPQ
jgi:uncharacterized protein